MITQNQGYFKWQHSHPHFKYMEKQKDSIELMIQSFWDTPVFSSTNSSQYQQFPNTSQNKNKNLQIIPNNYIPKSSSYIQKLPSPKHYQTEIQKQIQQLTIYNKNLQQQINDYEVEYHIYYQLSKQCLEQISSLNLLPIVNQMTSSSTISLILKSLYQLAASNELKRTRHPSDIYGIIQDYNIMLRDITTIKIMTSMSPSQLKSSQRNMILKWMSSMDWDLLDIIDNKIAYNLGLWVQSMVLASNKLVLIQQYKYKMIKNNRQLQKLQQVLNSMNYNLMQYNFNPSQSIYNNEQQIQTNLNYQMNRIRVNEIKDRQKEWKQLKNKLGVKVGRFGDHSNWFFEFINKEMQQPQTKRLFKMVR